jgi:hypothetical protein
MKIDREDFEAWMANPITEAMMACCGVWAEEAKRLWVSSSWEAGVNNDADLWRLRGQAEVLRDIPGITAEKIEETLSHEQKA